MLEAEFTVEPFAEGEPGPHVVAAWDAATAAGVEVAHGPFGSSLVGDDAVVLNVVSSIARAAVAAGATRVTIELRHP